MPRPFIFPDPDDRSPNSPSFIVSAVQVLGIYNQYTGEKMEKVTKKVQDWFCAEAKKAKWDKADFSGSQCILSVNIKKRNTMDD